MSTMIHPTAIVSEKARIAENVRIGAYAIVEDDVEIGSGTEVMYHAVLMSGTRVGTESIIYPGAVLGAAPQDLKYHGQKTYAVVGDRTTIRECATINKASHSEAVIVGNDCLIMAYTHVAHDCIVGNNVVIANSVQLGGHVHIGDWAILGGVSKVHQFCRVGKHAMVAADAMITKDVPPFVLTGRDPVCVEGINKIGLSRRGFSQDTVAALDDFVTTAFFSGLNMSDGIAAYMKVHTEIKPEVQDFISFIRESKRGVIR